MNCQDAAELLDGLVDGELEGGVAQQVRAHVAGCVPCASQVEVLRNLGGLLSRSLSPEAGESVNFAELWASVEVAIAEPQAAVHAAARQGTTRSRPTGQKRSPGRASPQSSQRPAAGRPAGRRWRVPAVSAGALAVAALSFVFLSADNEAELGNIASPGVELDGFLAAAPMPSPRAQALAEAPSLGPVAPGEEALASYWPPQVQPGPVQVSSHASAVWRQRAGR